MRHDDRMNETEGKTLAQGQGMNVPGETETREEAEMSREKGQDAEEKEAAPEAPQEAAAFDRQLEEIPTITDTSTYLLIPRRRPVPSKIPA